MSLRMNLNKAQWLRSIGWKLTLWNVSLILLFTITFSVYLYQRLEKQLYQEVDIFLTDELSEYSQFISDNIDALPIIKEQIKEESSAIRKHYQMYYGLLDSDGQMILQSSEFQPLIEKIQGQIISSLNEKEVNEYEIVDNEDVFHVRMATIPVKRNGSIVYYAQVGMNLARTEKTLSNYRQNIFYALPGILLVSLTGGYFLARRNLKPLSQMARTTDRITISNLKERLPLRGTGDELDELSRTFNEMIDRLDEAYQKLSQFSSDAAHELRTPLTSLIGEIEIALAQKLSAKEYHALLASNLEELTRLMRLVNNLLLLSQNEKPDATKKFEVINFNSIVSDMTELFEPVAQENDIVLTLDIPQDSLFFINGDKWRIEQLISNLLDNAIRYNYPGGRVKISLTGMHRWVQLTVSDTGIGISAADQKKVFDRFFRTDPSRSNHAEGSGLGLNIAKSVVTSHGGEITVASRLEKGTVFKVTFPLQKQTSQTSVAVPS